MQWSSVVSKTLDSGMGAGFGQGGAFNSIFNQLSGGIQNNAMQGIA